VNGGVQCSILAHALFCSACAPFLLRINGREPNCRIALSNCQVGLAPGGERSVPIWLSLAEREAKGRGEASRGAR